MKADKTKTMEIRYPSFKSENEEERYAARCIADQRELYRLGKLKKKEVSIYEKLFGWSWDLTDEDKEYLEQPQHTLSVEQRRKLEKLKYRPELIITAEEESTTIEQAMKVINKKERKR